MFNDEFYIGAIIDKRTIEHREENFAPVAALVAFWLATKFLERYPATLDDLMEMCDNRVQVCFLSHFPDFIYWLLRWKH